MRRRFPNDKIQGIKRKRKKERWNESDIERERDHFWKTPHIVNSSRHKHVYAVITANWKCNCMREQKAKVAAAAAASAATSGS